MLKFTTPCLAEGGWIPDEHTGFGEDSRRAYSSKS